jgi:hypothetical protein
MPCVALATSALDAGHAGFASGLVNTARQVGGTIGLAVLANIATAHAGHHPTADQVVHGYSLALLAAAGIAVLISLTALPARARDAVPGWRY